MNFHVHWETMIMMYHHIIDSLLFSGHEK